MRLTVVRVSISLVLLVFALALHSETPQRPKTMVFSYVEHPTMVNYLIPLITATYQKLDIEAQFVIQPSNRNLRLVEDNTIDGDVGYMRIVLTDYHNLITIEPPVVLGIFTLLCQPQIPCNRAILSDETQIVVTTSATQNGLLYGLQEEIKSQFYTVNNLSLIPEFITLKRFKYAIYPTSERDMWRIDTPDYQHVKLFDAHLYHVLHKKYAFMAADISQALAESLKEISVN